MTSASTSRRPHFLLVRSASPLLVAFWLAAFLSAPSPVGAQGLEQRVTWESFEREEPAWLLGLRLSGGWDLERKEGYPAVGLNIGFIGVDHLYLGGAFDARLTAPTYLRLGFRVGAFFTRADFAWGLGVSPGLLVVPERTEAGFCLTWGAMARLRLSEPHHLTAHIEADLLFEALGFRESRTFMTFGLGWAIAF